MGLCRALGLPVELSPPDERLQRILRGQVQEAKREAEAVLEQAKPHTASVAKSVVFALDCSSSMFGPRMSKAKENLLKIFDQYLDDADLLSMVTFARETRTVFDLQCIGNNREGFRRQAEAACVPNGSTSFYDALVASVEKLREAPSGHRKWIIALTDGEDTSSRRRLEDAFQALQSSPAEPTLLIVGVQLDLRLKPDMEKLCSATGDSLFLDAAGGAAAMDQAFEEVAELICYD